MTAFAATEASLDKLQQQVDNGQVSISSACTRIENIIETLLRDDTTRPFLGLLSRLLNIFFGEEHKMGWVELAEDCESINALFNLLQPKGLLFSACLSYSCVDGIAPFDLSINQLPVPMQKLIKDKGNHALAAPFDICVSNVNREGPPLYLLHLDAAEFFLFRFLSMLLSIKKHGLAQRSGSQFLNQSAPLGSLMRSHTFESLKVKLFNEKSFRFSHDGCARLYSQLLQNFLSFFMPLSLMGKAEAEGTAFSIRTLRSSSGQWTGWKLANFFAVLLNELWLHQFDYKIDAEMRIESDPSFQLPSVDHFECIRIQARHLISATTLPIPSDIPPQLQRYYDQLVK